MAGNNALEVSVGKPRGAGCIYAVTTVPTDAVAPLAGATNFGYVSDAGITNNEELGEAEFYAFGGDLVGSVTTTRKELFEFEFIQTNPDTLKAFYGPENVAGDLDTGITVLHNGEEMPVQAYVIDTVMTGGVLKRDVIELGKLKRNGAVVAVTGEIVKYPVQLKCLADDNGDTAKTYFARIAASGE